MAEAPQLQGTFADPSMAPTPAFQPQAPAAAFGGSIGQGLSTLGQDAGNVALKLQGLQNETTATNMSANYMADLGQLKGDFYAKQGADAVAAAPKYRQDVLALRQKYIDQSPNPAVAEMIGNDVAHQTGYALVELGVHVPQQMLAASKQASASRIDNAAQAAVGVRNDPDQVAAYAARAASEVGKIGELEGWDRDTVQAKTAQTLGSFYQKTIGALLVEGRPDAAASMFDGVKANLDAASQDRIAEQIKAPLVESHLQKAADAAAGMPTLGATGFDNNTFNLRAGSTQWEGKGAPHQTPNGPFETFGSGVQGAAAGVANAQYQYNKLPSEKQNFYGLMNVLSPSSDNNKPNSMAEQMASAAGLKPTDPVPFGNAQALLPAMRTLATIEKGKPGGGLDDATLLAGINTAISKGSAMANATLPDRQAMQQRGQAAVAADPILANDPRARDAMEAEINHRYSLMEAGQTQQRAVLSKTLDDTEAALLAGKAAPIPETQIRSVFPPEQADRIVDGLHEAQASGLATKTVATASAAQIPDILKAANPGNDTSIDNFAARQRQYQRLAAAVQRRSDALSDDPASYAIQNLPAVAAAYGAMQAKPGDPAATTAYVAATKAEQTRLGVPQSQQSVMPANEAAAWVKRMTTIDPKEGTPTEVLNALQKQYGDNYNDALQSLQKAGMPKGWGIAASLNAPGQEAVADDVARTNQFIFQNKGGVKDLEAMAGPGAASKIDKALSDPSGPNLLGEFGATTRYTSRGLELQSDVQTQVRNLALYYAGTGRAPDPDTAAKMAVDGVLNAHYDFVGTARVPKGKADDFTQAGARYLDGLNPGDVALPPNNARPAQFRPFFDLMDKDSMLRAAQHGTYVTNADNKGVSLMGWFDKVQSYLPLYGKDGAPLGFQFDKMPALNDSPVARDMRRAYGAFTSPLPQAQTE